MNWRRGLFRAWVALSITWALLAGFVWQTVPEWFYPGVPIGLFILPPLALGAVMALVAWAAAGFAGSAKRRL